jgi:hypothetical protein
MPAPRWFARLSRVGMSRITRHLAPPTQGAGSRWLQRSTLRGDERTLRKGGRMAQNSSSQPPLCSGDPGRVRPVSSGELLDCIREVVANGASG